MPLVHGRIPMLDGWRALSILSVMAGHLLPLGFKTWALNEAVAAFGMVIFFNLSGFLITSFLLRRDDVPDFIARRLTRILPLAWAAMLILVLVSQAGWNEAAWNFAFLSNLPPTHLLHGGEHLWSLCVEVQFYLAIALVVAVLGKRGLLLLPLLSLVVTGVRVMDGARLSIFTYERIDEILAGATVALVYHRWGRLRVPAFATILIAPLALLSCHVPLAGWISYLRPYLAAAMIGCSLYAAPRHMRSASEHRATLYIAEVSYGLYVFHGMLMASPLGAGTTTVIKYLKRPVLIAATFLLAHLSYRYYETPIRRSGYRAFRRLAERGRASVQPSSQG